MVNFLFRIIWIHWRRHQGGWRLTEVSRLKGDKDRNLLFRQKLKRLKIKYWCQNILLNFSSRLTNDSLELQNLIESLYEQHLWHFFLSSAAFCAAYKICHLGPKASDCSPSEAIWLFIANLTTLPSLGCRWRVSWSCIRGGKTSLFRIFRPSFIRAVRSRTQFVLIIFWASFGHEGKAILYHHCNIFVYTRLRYNQRLHNS